MMIPMTTACLMEKKLIDKNQSLWDLLESDELNGYDSKRFVPNYSIKYNRLFLTHNIFILATSTYYPLGGAEQWQK
jgi:hypothetical protein